MTSTHVRPGEAALQAGQYFKPNPFRGTGSAKISKALVTRVARMLLVARTLLVVIFLLVVMHLLLVAMHFVEHPSLFESTKPCPTAHTEHFSTSAFKVLICPLPVHMEHFSVSAFTVLHICYYCKICTKADSLRLTPENCITTTRKRPQSHSGALVLPSVVGHPSPPNPGERSK